MEEQGSGVKDDWSQEEDNGMPEIKNFSPTECLFCNGIFEGVDGNVEHMFSQHGLFIPEPQNLADVETFILYLGRVVGHFQECLYCGLVKSTVQSVQQHMVDKGHCMLNFDRESELLDFWQYSDMESDGEAGETDDHDLKRPSNRVEQPQRLSANELRLPSGAIVGSRSEGLRPRPDYTRRRSPMKETGKALPQPGSQSNAEATPEGSTVTDRRLAVRNEMGLTGLSNQQRRALAVVEKKMQKKERVARAAHLWAREKVANRQKHYVVSFRLRSPGGPD
jgi:pre-60S factor REI1